MSRKWTPERLDTLRHLYPVMTNREIAGVLEISISNLVSAARRLGLTKGVKIARERQKEHISRYFSSRSMQTLAFDLGITKTTVSRIAASLGLARSRQEMKAFNSDHRAMLVKREKRRLIFGLDPVSGIKVVTNRRKITLRYRLKRKGYVPGEERNVMYYPDDVIRNRSQESFGESLGLRFMPLPVS